MRLGLQTRLKKFAREEKIQSTKAEIEAERNKIAELTRIIQLEKEMSKVESKEIELQERQLKKQGYATKKNGDGKAYKCRKGKIG